MTTPNTLTIEADGGEVTISNIPAWVLRYANYVRIVEASGQKPMTAQQFLDADEFSVKL